MTHASFDSTKTRLEELLERAHTGSLQLPDFQRGWIWDDERIRSLLASVSVSFPIGAVMLLETGGEHVNFKPRPMAGANIPPDTKPDDLILDGQQRLTSLYGALKCSMPVETRDTKRKPIRRWYYIDMDVALQPEADREDAVIGVPEDRLVRGFGRDVRLDVSSPEREFKQYLFPMNLIFDSDEWRMAYDEYWEYNQEKIRLFNRFNAEVIARFKQYDVPVIDLKKENPKEAVCLVFERVNTGGVALTVFELLTASFAAENFQLRDDWANREQRLKRRYPVLHNLQSDDFLQAISLLVTQNRRGNALEESVAADKAPGISCKRRDILKLEVADWTNWADRVEEGFEHAAKFLHGQKIFKARDLPYRTQLVPLASVFTALGAIGDTEGAKQKIAQWYWCGVLGELYGAAIESRFARDLPEIVAFVRDGAGEPVTISESNFQAARLLTLRTRNSSAYKGIYALLMRDGGRDFRTGVPIEAQAFFDETIDIHHIFPERWCKSQGIGADFYNCVINKTAISARTNRQIGGSAPSEYVPAIERSAGIECGYMDEIFASHCVKASRLRSDDFWGFFAARAESLLQRIETATGKKIPREPNLFGHDSHYENYDDGSPQWVGEQMSNV